MEEEVEIKLRRVHAELVRHGLNARATEEVLDAVVDLTQAVVAAAGRAIIKAVNEGRI